jgi:hypothetical protein
MTTEPSRAVIVLHVVILVVLTKCRDRLYRSDLN